MAGLLGKKIGMTSVFNDKGELVACTIIKAGPCVVTQVKTLEKDGYDALQLGFDERKEKNVPKPLLEIFKKANTTPKRFIKEIKGWNNEYKVGDIITVDIFKDTKYVDIIGWSKGKGFQGVVKRHGFAGVGERTHGQHNRLRAPGSLGASSDPSRVFKGMRMAGRMGNKRVKIFNLELIKIFPEEHLLLVKGAVPGYYGSYLIILK